MIRYFPFLADFKFKTKIRIPQKETNQRGTALQEDFKIACYLRV
jgi:hypothetical protein